VGRTIPKAWGRVGTGVGALYGSKKKSKEKKNKNQGKVIWGGLMLGGGQFEWGARWQVQRGTAEEVTKRGGKKPEFGS